MERGRFPASPEAGGMQRKARHGAGPGQPLPQRGQKAERAAEADGDEPLAVQRDPQ